MVRYRYLLMLKISQLFSSAIYLWNKDTHVPEPVLSKKQIAYTSLPTSSKSVTIWHEQTKCSELAGYRQIEDNFELGLRNRAFLSELDSKEPKDNELERLTMFSTVLMIYV
ncbi:hypothetical protein Glove_281g7 [Diversispora epigaea]|uniref:Uncharacterized protein n=1 Tax=Diversispora epigaea TaxID=1348612 RepID=A0A397I1Z2_9GLOM|nr:hypothetical protein Glove_281g7 [Diversispora epigaea]